MISQFFDYNVSQFLLSDYRQRAIEWDPMQLHRRRRRQSKNRTPLVVAALIVLAAAIFIGRSAVFSSRQSDGSAASQAGTASYEGQASVEPTSTATPSPTPTATPVPPPVKNTNAPLPSVSAVSAVAIDDKSGAVLYEKNPHLQRAPASITKIVTAIVAIEHANPSDLVTVRYDASELVDSTLMGVNPGDKLTLEDLLYGLMLPSGNEAAVAIANHVAGSEQAFVDLMNEKMKDLGLTDSHFANPHGLDAKGHYSSAYDMAMIARYGMRYPLFRQLAAAKVHTVNVWRATNGEKQSYDIYNLNKLLSIYPGADGVKIGFTENAWRTIVGTAVRNGHRVYVALMGSNDLWTDTPRVLDYIFKNFSWPADN